MLMPKRMQILKLQDELRRLKISPDTVDLEAHVDSKISYPENARNILSKFERRDNKKTKSHRGATLGGIGNIDLHYASQYHQTRTPTSRSSDEARKNKNTYTERDLNKRPSLLDGWFRRPGNSDIWGIDAFGRSKPTKKHKSKRR